MYTRNPREMSAYVQDKMEFFDLIVNIGLRFDYFDANSVVPADLTDPNIYDPFRPENKYRNWIEPPSDMSYSERQAYEKKMQERRLSYEAAMKAEQERRAQIIEAQKAYYVRAEQDRQQRDQRIDEIHQQMTELHKELHQLMRESESKEMVNHTTPPQQ